MKFDLSTAQAYAQSSRLEEWVHAYLATGEWANLGLSDGLKLQQRWWIDPIEVPLDLLIRVCGPEPEMLYTQDAAGWEKRVGKISNSLEDSAALPPLIVHFDDGDYIISDGNHRHEAMVRKGWSHCWIIIWYDSREEWQASPYLGKRCIGGKGDRG